MIAYHIDRTNSFKAGDVVNLFHPKINPSFLQEVISQRYPEGISAHGGRYFANVANKDTLQDALAENLLENERMLKYPDKISRFQALFATDTLEASLVWLQQESFKKYDCVLWVIEFDHSNFVKLDASWLGANKDNLSFLQAIYRADHYWSGKQNENPIWELLIKPPIRFLRKVPKETIDGAILGAQEN